MSSPAARHFARHYVEMLIAMFGGMLVLGGPALAALAAAGVSSSEMQDEAPAVYLLGMGVVMTVPMVAWMRHRGHGWRPNAEMAASMLLPTFAAIALLAAGAGSFMTLMMAEHSVMPVTMLGAMLLRPSEYTGGLSSRAATA